MVTTQQLLNEIKAIKIEIKMLREILPDKDMFLTAEESRLLSESYENEKKGKLISSKALRKKLGI